MSATLVSSHLDLWLDALKRMEQKLERGSFITWFRGTTVLGKDESTVVIGLPLPMFLNWHLEHYRALTLETLQEIDPTIEKIVYQVDGSLKDDKERTIDLLAHFPEQKKRKLPRRNEVKLAEGLTSKLINPRYTLENFVIGSGNRLAHAACSAVAKQPGGKYNPLFLYGGVGLGKTHLLQATGNAILKVIPNAAVVYTTSEDFTNQVVEAIQSRKMEQLRRRYRSVDVLIIDDVQFLTKKERTQEEFFHTFNALYEDRKQIIVSSDRAPEQLSNSLESRIVSRFERGMIADVQSPDYETRLAILSEKAKEYELFLDTNVLAFIAEHATKNVRELEGILMQAVAQYELEHRMPTIKSIAEIMQKLHKETGEDLESESVSMIAKKRATHQDILEGVSRYYSVSVQDMLGQSRVRDVLMPRQIAMYLMKKYLGTPYTRIGESFSYRDHTTVMHAVNKIEKTIHQDSLLLREVNAIKKDIDL